MKEKSLYKTGTKFRNKLSILEPISEVIASEIIKAFNIPCANNILKNMKLPSFDKEVLVHLRNFSVVVKKEETLKFSPLYDHGLSLYADIQEFELE